MTLRLISFLVVFAFSYFMSKYSGGFAWNFAFWTFAIMLVYAVVSVILMRIFLNIRNENIKSRVERGNSVKASFLLECVFSLPFSKVIILCSEGKVIANAPIHGKTEVEYGVDCPHCGRYSHGADRVWLTDAFGLLKIPCKKIENRIFTTVVPAVKQMKKCPYKVMGTATRTSVMSKTQEHEEVAGVRPFEDGDTVKNIHWKQSARRFELMTTEYEEPADSMILLVIDRNCSDRKLLVDKEIKADIAGEYAISVVNAVLKCEKYVHSVIITDNMTAQRDIRSMQKLGDAEIDFASIHPVYSQERPVVTELLKCAEHYFGVVYVCYEFNKQTENVIKAFNNSGTYTETVIVGQTGEEKKNTFYINNENDIEKMQVPYGC